MENTARRFLSAACDSVGWSTGIVLFAVLLALTFGFRQRAFAQTQSASGDCPYWIDVGTGKKVVNLGPPGWGTPGVPVGVSQYEYNGHGYAQQPDGSWIDVGTGAKIVTLGPPGWGTPGVPVGVSQYEYNGHAYLFVPCPSPTTAPPPTPTPTPTPEPNPRILWDDPFDLGFGFAGNRTPDEVVKKAIGFGVNAFINVKTWVEHGYSNHARSRSSAKRGAPKASVGIEADFMGAFGSTTVGTVKTSLRRYLYLFGPRFNFYPSHKTRLFVHPLFGGVHDSGTITIGTTSTTGSANAFAMAFGGGLDIALNKRFAVRPFQLDYVPTHFGGAWQNNFRFSTGVVFRFPKKK